MIKIAGSKIKTSGVLITEEVVLRTIQNSREGEIVIESGKTYLKFWYDYKAYLKSVWDTDGINSRTIAIDNLNRGNIVLIDVSEVLNITNLVDMSIFFNTQYIPTLKTDLNLIDGDIEIINM